MAILKFKQFKADLENNTSVVLDSMTKTAATATLATLATLATKATSAGYAGTSRVAHFASSGTAALAGTSLIFATGL